MPTGVYKRTREHKRKQSIAAKKRPPINEETKRKISNSHIGKILSEEHKKKISKSMEGKNKGKILGPLSEETKRKISESSKGKKLPPLSKEHKRKISESKKGKNNPAKRPEVRKKISESVKELWKDPEYIKKISESMKEVWKDLEFYNNNSGSNHHCWKGGISCESYCDVWLDEEYKNSIKERDGNKCINPYCSGIYKRLSLHHINYNKKDCKPTNLITICIPCNSKANKDRDWHQSWYEAIIYRRYLRSK